MSFKVLESVLRPLAYWYNQENIEEVAVNRSGQVWLRLRGKRAYPWVMYKDEKLTKEYLTDLLYIIANTYELPFDPVQGTPVVYATIPGDHRFSAVSGRNVMYDQDDLTGGVALTIRVHSDDVAFGLQDYGLKQGESLHKVNPLKDIQDPEDPYERLLLSIKRGDHILVSGATATGKTTFLNNLLKILDIHKRIITISPNNAGALWELMGSGHDNCLATIHAESSEAAYEAFVDRILHSYPTIDREKTIKEMHRKLRVVQINRDGNLRAVTEVT